MLFRAEEYRIGGEYASAQMPNSEKALPVAVVAMQAPRPALRHPHVAPIRRAVTATTVLRDIDERLSYIHRVAIDCLEVCR